MAGGFFHLDVGNSIAANPLTSSDLSPCPCCSHCLSAPFHAVTMCWWRKSPEEMAAAVRERNRSKVGRMARLKDAVEAATPQLEALS